MFLNITNITPVHTHSNNFLSGTYYLQSDQGASIVFHDPRPQVRCDSAKKKEKTLIILVY